MDGINEQGMKEFLVSVAMFFITPIFIGFASYLQKRTGSEIMRNIVMGIGGVGILLNVMEYERRKNSYLFENKRRYVWLGFFLYAFFPIFHYIFILIWLWEFFLYFLPILK